LADFALQVESTSANMETSTGKSGAGIDRQFWELHDALLMLRQTDCAASEAQEKRWIGSITDIERRMYACRVQSPAAVAQKIRRFLIDEEEIGPLADRSAVTDILRDLDGLAAVTGQSLLTN
jgi:hypothetical protein